MTSRIRPLILGSTALALGLGAVAVTHASAQAPDRARLADSTTAATPAADGSWGYGFETGLDGMSAHSNARLARVTSPSAHGGSYSLKVKGTAAPWSVGEAAPGHGVQAGTSYDFSAWARRIRGNPAVTMNVAWTSPGGTVLKVDKLGTLTTNSSWRKLAGTAVAPSNASAATVRFTGSGLRAWQLDDVAGAQSPAAGSTPTSGPTQAPTQTPTQTPAPTQPPTQTPTQSPTQPAPTPTQTPTQTPTGQNTCTNPSFVTTDPNGMWNNGGYVVHNNMWNVGGYNVSEKLSACAYNSWFVSATADDSKHDGAVKTYPNVHKDFHNWSTGVEPKLSSFSSIKSTYGATSPHTGVYDVAYDIWLNGVADNGSTEVMIWTDNQGQTPSGRKVAQVSLSGHTWDVWASTDNKYIAFVPVGGNVPSGSLDLKGFFDYLTGAGRLASTSTLGQICYGVEVVSTNGQPATFDFNDFSVTSN